MKPKLFLLLPLFFLALLAACAPTATTPVKAEAGGVFPIKTTELWSVQFNIGSQVTRVDFSLNGAPNLDSDNWVYADFKTSTPYFGGTGAVPDDRKSLILLFNADQKGASQFSCVVPMSADLTTGAKGNGAQFLNDRKIGDFACSIGKIK